MMASSDSIIVERGWKGINGVVLLRINRPKVKNAWNREMYERIPELFTTLGNDKDIRVVILTGVGDFYSSGNDLSNFTKSMQEGMDIQQMTEDAKVLLEKFVQAFISFPKILIAAVNGPALGIAVTTLSLCDFVYAAEKSTFETPFMKLAQAPEGCSSFTFPRLMSPLKANEILLLGKKFTSSEALHAHLVNAVLPDVSKLEEEVMRVATILSSHPPGALMSSKKLLREPVRQELEAANKRECVLLRDLWGSEECMEAIINFFSSKSSSTPKTQSKL